MLQIIIALYNKNPKRPARKVEVPQKKNVKIELCQGGIQFFIKIRFLKKYPTAVRRENIIYTREREN